MTEKQPLRSFFGVRTKTDTGSSLGLAVPFLLSALFLHEMTGRWKRLRLAGRSLQSVAAVVMVVMGVAIMTGELTRFSYWLLETFPALARIG